MISVDIRTRTQASLEELAAKFNALPIWSSGPDREYVCTLHGAPVVLLAETKVTLKTGVLVYN